MIRRWACADSAIASLRGAAGRPVSASRRGEVLYHVPSSRAGSSERNGVAAEDDQWR